MNLICQSFWSEFNKKISENMGLWLAVLTSFVKKGIQEQRWIGGQQGKWTFDDKLRKTPKFVYRSMNISV